MADEQQGFFRRAGGRISDFFSNAGQALGGAFDQVAGGAQARELGYSQGLEERSARELAMERAMAQREETRAKQLERAARENLGYSLSRVMGVPTYEAEPYADIIRAGAASDFSSLTSGRGNEQELRLRDLIASPAEDDERLRAMEALSPASGVNQRLSALFGGDDSTTGPLEIVLDDDGQAVYVPRSEAIGQRPGTRPSAAAGASGGLKASDTNAIYRMSSGLFGGTFDPLTGRIAGLSRDQSEQVQRIASRASQIYASGGIDHATAVDIALQEMRTEAGIPAPSLGQSFAAPAAPEPPAPAVPALSDPLADVPQISSPEELAALPSGARFMAPDGSIRVKP